MERRRAALGCLLLMFCSFRSRLEPEQSNKSALMASCGKVPEMETEASLPPEELEEKLTREGSRGGNPFLPVILQHPCFKSCRMLRLIWLPVGEFSLY